MATITAAILRGDIHVRQDGTTNIKIRITHRGRVQYIPTTLYVAPRKFTGGHVKGSDKNATFLNSRIRDELTKYTNRYLSLADEADILNASELRDRLTIDTTREQIDFHRFAKDYHRELTAGGKAGSAQAIISVINHLQRFRGSLYFHEIDIHFLNDFTAYLRDNGVHQPVDNYMRAFRLIYKKAMDRYNDDERGIYRISTYPFRRYKFPKSRQQSNRQSLTSAQVKVMAAFPTRTVRERIGVDVFMIMMCLVGINGKDLFLLQPPARGRINYRRSKTGRDFSIPVTPELTAYMKAYAGAGSRAFNFSQRYRQHPRFLRAANFGLQSICKRMHAKFKEDHPGQTLDFPETISNSWARHTWATIARMECGANKDDIALCMGHQDNDNRVTDMYITYDHTIMDRTVRAVLDRITRSGAGDVQSAH